MWIQLTDVTGQPIAVNTDHVVSVQAYGNRTMLTHVAGQQMVLENTALVMRSFCLRQFEERPDPANAPKTLHS